VCGVLADELQLYGVTGRDQAQDGDVVGDTADALASPALTALGLGHRPVLTAADARAAPLSNDGEQIVAELAAGQHVNDEVDRRVEDSHEITDSRVVVMPAAAVTLVTLVLGPAVTP